MRKIQVTSLLYQLFTSNRYRRGNLYLNASGNRCRRELNESRQKPVIGVANRQYGQENPK